MPSSADDEDSCIKNSCECCGAALAVIVMCLGLVAATAAALTFGIIFLLYEDSQKTAGIILVTIGSFGLLILILLRAAPNFLAVCCAYIWCCECCEKDEEENTEQVNQHRPRNWHEVRSSPRPHIPNQAQTVHLPSHPTPYPVGSFFAPEPPQMRNPRHLREPDILTSPPPYTEHPTEPPPSYEEALCNSLAAECALAGGVVTAL